MGGRQHVHGAPRQSCLLKERECYRLTGHKDRAWKDSGPQACGQQPRHIRVGLAEALWAGRAPEAQESLPLSPIGMFNSKRQHPRVMGRARQSPGARVLTQFCGCFV